MLGSEEYSSGSVDKLLNTLFTEDPEGQLVTNKRIEITLKRISMVGVTMKSWFEMKWSSNASG